jgi:peptidoglycan hydrolase-like protein with peptidoglycan-binding domain
MQIVKVGSKGDAVRHIQELLGRAGFDPGGVDGDFGRKTEAAVKDFQQAKGLLVDGEVGPDTLAALEGGVAHANQVPEGIRGEIVANALFGVAHEADIHYEQLRPIDGIGDVHKLPLNVDCSGFATLCYNWAGAPDPNGLGYNGLGYTGTLLNHMDRIDRDAALPGDLVVIGPGSGDHVVIIVEAGSDPMVVSHGREAGPTRQRLSVDGREPKRFLRSRSDDSVLFDDDGTTGQVTIPLDLSNVTNAPEA